MFPRNNRLQRNAFSAVQSHGRAFHTDTLTIRLTLGHTQHKFSVVVSKKVARSAVARHRARRRLYSALAQIARDLSEPVHAIVFARKGVEHATYEELCNTLRTQFIKAGVMAAR